MFVSSVHVRKVDETDPRFPGWDAVKHTNGKIVGFSALYLCEMQTNDGPMETPFFVTDALSARHTNQEILAMMFEAFARAVRDAKIEQAA